MSGLPATFSIGIDPEIEVGPVTLAWHGLMIAAGIALGGWLAGRHAAERGLDREPLLGAVAVIGLAGIVGARFFFLLEDDPGALVQPGEWLEARGFAFYGAIFGGVPAVAVYLRRTGVPLRYLDALAAGFPLGMAVGRVGDLVNGEHHGPPSDLPWAIRYTHPDAEVPSAAVAYHPGGLYEIVLALVLLAGVWPLRHRFRQPGMLLAAVVAAYSAGRFLMFFYRSDSETLALGLNGAQWTSLALVAVTAAWALLLARRRRAHRADGQLGGASRRAHPKPGA